MSKKNKIFYLAVLFVILADQFTKWLIMFCIPEHKTVSVISGFFDLVNIRNRGAAFGFLNRSDIEWQFWLFLGATIVATWIIISIVRDIKNSPFLCGALGLVLGGAISNLFDRIRFRAVVDFLDFYIGTWHWPAFNVADMAICIGGFFAFLLYLKTSEKIRI